MWTASAIELDADTLLEDRGDGSRDSSQKQFSFFKIRLERGESNWVHSARRPLIGLL
jgi:hypothetical protein